MRFGSYFHHDVILIQALIDVGDLALAKGVAEGVVDVLYRNPEAAGGSGEIAGSVPTSKSAAAFSKPCVLTFVVARCFCVRRSSRR